MAYSATSAGKLMNQLEALATDWMSQHVCEFFDVMSVEELDEDQIEEISEYLENNDLDQYVALGLHNVMDRWSMEHENEDFSE